MKQGIKIFLITILLAAILIGAYFAYDKLKSSTPSTDTAVSQNGQSETAADFTAITENGDEVKLSDYFGKPVIVNFWATWCGYCVHEMPLFESAYKEYGEDINFIMLNLTDMDRETVESAKQFISENGYTFPVLFDAKQDALNAYETYSIPVTLFINSDGTIYDKQIGALDENTLNENINAILK